MATVSCGTTSERFGFIQRHGSVLGVRYLCDWLGVSKSGYYDWCKRKPSKRAVDDAELLIHIQRIFERSWGTYGSPRVFEALINEGFCIGENRVARLMRAAGLQARAIRYYRKGAKMHEYYLSITNKRLDLGPPTMVDQQWSGDITYLKVDGKWVFLATIMDLYSRKIIAWGLSKHRGIALTQRVMRQALKRRQPSPGLLFHSDRGSEYRARKLQRFLEGQGVVSSMNRPFKSIDNAEMESFFKTLKGDLIRGNVFKTLDELRARLRAYIDYFYNRERMHSSLGYRSPMEFEEVFS